MSMTEFHRKILEKVAPDFLNDLDSEDIVPYLVADEAISRHDREKIYTKGTRREKVAALLDILPRRGDGAYTSLLSSLTKADGSKHLYDKMKKHEQWVSDQLQQELNEEKPPLQGTSSSEDNSTRGLGRSDTLQAGEEPPDDEFAHILQQIADDLYDEAKIDSLAGQLGILQGDIQRALMKNVKFNRVTSNGTRHMLKQWRRGVPREVERMELRKALQAAMLVNLADLYLREEQHLRHTPIASSLQGASSQYLEREKGDEEVKPDEEGYYKQQMRQANPSQDQLDPEKNYKMDVLPKGHMFILNIGKDMKGSDTDVQNIEHVFKEIGFEIETYSDLTAKELKDKLETFVNSPYHQGMCSAVFMFMGHSTKTGIRCSDKQVVPTKFIMDKVSGMKNMNGKPKMIFFLCCCGVDHEEKVETDQAETDVAKPAISDIFIFHGKVAYGDKVRGSRFIQRLCEELLKNAHVSDLSTMMEQLIMSIDERMAFNESAVCMKQGISKKIYFLPKYGNDYDGGLSAPPEILARGPRARRAYAEAAQAGTKKVFRTRLMLVGQERVGKTSLKKTLTGQGFDRNEAITDGVETTNACEISIEVAKAGEKTWLIHKKGHENEDTKEDEYNKALADEIAKRLTVTPPKDQKPQSNTILDRGLNPVEAGDETAKRLTRTPPQDQERLGKHSDSSLSRGLNPEAAEEFVSDNVEAPNAKEEDGRVPNHLASLVEKNLKEQKMGADSSDSGRGEGISISIWDFAGHDIYYTTHQVFLTRRAIYVIVFDLSRSLDSAVPLESRDEYYEMAKGDAKSDLTCLEFINFWLCSIFAHAVAPSSVRSKNTSKTAQKSPPIFIVGTHRESGDEDPKQKKKRIRSAFEKIRKSIMKKPFECHVVPKYYAIENSLEDNDEELVALRRHIEKVAMEEPYMGEEIPLRWLFFEEAIAAEKNFMSLDQTKELMRPVGMESESKLLPMLTFYHDLGYVVYYGGIEDQKSLPQDMEQKSLLRDMVILNPQWLIDVFKQVITILDPAERDGIVSDAWTTLEEEGILEDRLIEHMWQDKEEPKEALVQLMAKFDLICEAPVEQLKQEQEDRVDTEVSNETEKMVKKRYYVPSRLTSHCSLEDIGQIKSSTDFYVDFRGFLPDWLFHRLMTRAVKWMDERDGEPVDLFYRQIRLVVDDEHRAFLEMLPPPEANIKVTVFRGLDPGSDDDQPPEPSAVKEVMDFVTRTLDSLRQHWAKGIKYDVCIQCPCPNPSCCQKPLLERCLKRKSLTCGKYNISTASIKSKFDSIPFMMAKSLKTKEKTEPARDDTPSASGPTSSQTHGFDDVIIKVADSISDDGDLRRLGLELGVQIPVINRALETNWAGATKTSNGNVIMLQNWAETVESSKIIQTLRTALKRARLLEVEETCFTSSSRDSIPFTMGKRIKTKEMTEPLKEDTQSKSGQTLSQTDGIDDTIIKVAESISDDGDLKRLGLELGVQIPVINRALETNWAGGTKTSNGNVMMFQNWAKTVEASKRLPTFRTALKRARLLEVEETCFTSSTRGIIEEGVESGNKSPVMPKRSRITEVSLGNTNSTSLRPSTSASTVVDTPPQGASAPVGKASTSKAREVSDAMLNRLAKQIPGKDYDTFSEKLSIPHNQARTILEGYCNNYAKATRDCMAIWMNKSTRFVADLHGVLRAADLSGLIVHCD